MEMFPSIISRARTLQVVASSASANANGSLHLVSIMDPCHDNNMVPS